MKRWSVKIEEDPETGDGILNFPPDMLEEAGWKEGDTLIWKDLEDGTWSLTKKDDTVAPPEEEEAWKELDAKLNKGDKN
jgi:hypothetical protein